MFRFETMVIALVLGSPVAALWWRGDFTDADVWWRFGLCWLAAWAAVALVSRAARPIAGTTPTDLDADADDPNAAPEGDDAPREPAPAAPGTP